MKRSQTFDEYRRNHAKARVKLINKAIKHLSGGDFKSLTNFAKAVAKLVTEFEQGKYAEEGGDSPPELKPISHVTLLRNKVYRDLLEEFLEVKKDTPNTSISSISDLEALKFANQSLMAKNNWLTQQIRAIDSGAAVSQIEGEGNQSEIEGLNRDLNLTVGLINSLLTEFGGVLKTVKKGETTPRFSEPGLWGPMNKIASDEDMFEVDRICKDVAAWRKKPKQLSAE